MQSTQEEELWQSANHLVGMEVLPLDNWPSLFMVFAGVPFKSSFLLRSETMTASRGEIIVCPACGTKNRIPPEKQGLTPKCGRCQNRLSGVFELTDQNFSQVIGATSLPILVDFYSPTCGPCRMIAPIVEELARRYQGRVLVAKLDTSRHPMTPARFQIRGVPTLIFFRQGQIADQVVGAVPAQELEARLQRLL